MTLGLAFITGNSEGTKRLVTDYGQYFDKIYITVALPNKTLYHQLKHDYEAHAKVKLSYYPCDINHPTKPRDSFGRARIFNQSQVKTDYWFWCDTDDEIDHPELIRPLVERMKTENMDMLFMNYNYYQNAHNEGQADHWRERLVRTDSAAKWLNAVCHETIDASQVRAERTTSVSVIHKKSVEDMVKTVDRNHRLLINDWKTKSPKDPRTAYYLGMTYLTKGKYEEAVKKFLYLIEKGGWDQQKIVAWCAIADAYFFSQQYDKALVATNMAMHLDPSHPDPYYQKVIIYCSAQQYEKAVEWSAVALTKQPKKDTMQLIDPTKYTYKGIFLAAQAYLFSGRVKEGFNLFQRVKEIAPHFIVDITKELGADWERIFNEAFYDEKAIEYAKYLLKYTKDYNGNSQELFKSLPKKIYADARLNVERVETFPPKKWPPKTIAYYCGPSVAPWGPDMLKDGVGGSEEAVIYLSRELAKLGWQVTIYGDREDEYEDFDPRIPSVKVTYKPWTELNPFDEFDVFIASRQPQNLKGIKARLKILDMHDVNQPEQVEGIQNDVDKIFVKSKWHRNCYPNIPDDKFVIVGNGILAEQFK